MTDHVDSPLPPGGRHKAGTYQMLWDCKFCGTEKLLGVTHRHCPNCGAAQDPEQRYLPAEEDMVALTDHKFVGADKLCPACEQPNSAASSFCSECGADLSKAAAVAVQAGRDIGEGRAESTTKRDVVKDKFEAEMVRIGATEPGPSFLGLRKREWLILGGVALVVLIIAGIVYAVTYRKSTHADVVEMAWERVIEIEEFGQQSGQGWDEQVPGDAYRVTCDRRERGKEKVKVGEKQECEDKPQGDGSFKRECRNVPIYDEKPVYDQWCSYTVDRWDYARSAKASGNWFSPEPYWPQYTLASGSGKYGQERAGNKHETYKVVVRENNGDRHACDFDSYDRWRQFNEGAQVELDLYITGGADCDSLKVVN